MRPTPMPGCHWDGSPHTRLLRMAPTSPSRLLRAGHSTRCRHCGHRIDLYQRTDRGPIALHRAELAIAHVPEACRWHLSGGLAHPHGDGSTWCRIPHAVLCPARTPTCPLSPFLEDARRDLAVRTRRLIDIGALTPAPAPAGTAAPENPDHTGRPVVQVLLVRYLAPAPLEAIRCVAQTRHHHRCTRTVLVQGRPVGRWRLLPTGSGCGQPALPDTLMAVYDLSHLPHTEQRRWRAQRCPTHAATLGTADLAPAAWQVFDPLLHAAHIHTRLPHPEASPRREG
ncbi:DUF6083 domain-containing protein [Streptomyces gilvifuscus]|uniref:DUF6083 domain-containing protein n=1 Tax=Streptomyces gilvifuscus TaxID=1550617 RepID=A0ABT5G6D9_9ACTN|nr:DUF6083 domain-containing protein [Streptomyces gilvifuscus]MDC2960398.1 DUF6083 domain-containing protein [Streptomyces gilvifuscus]